MSEGLFPFDQEAELLNVAQLILIQRQQVCPLKMKQPRFKHILAVYI